MKNDPCPYDPAPNVDVPPSEKGERLTIDHPAAQAALEAVAEKEELKQ